MALTAIYAIRIQSFVIEAESLRKVVKIWMLKSQGPLREVTRKITISDCNFYSPIFFVISLDMPMDFDRTHVPGAIQNVRLTGCCRAGPRAHCRKIVILRVPARQSHS
jgi:hypothetical protein